MWGIQEAKVFIDRGCLRKIRIKTSVIAVNFDGITSLNPTVLMGLNAWQSEIFKVFTYLSFPRKRPFCTLTKLRRRNAKRRIAKFPIVLHFYTNKRQTWRHTELSNITLTLCSSLAVCSLFWLAVVRLVSLSTVGRQFMCACSVNLAWSMTETAGIRLCQFVSEEMKDTSENNNGLSIWNNLSWDNLSCHLFLCNLDGGVKILKL